MHPLRLRRVLPDEKQQTTADFVTQALRYFARRGIVVTRVGTDNGSRVFAAALSALAALACWPLCTRPYPPRTSGKAERFIGTLLAEWAHAQRYRTNLARKLDLPHYLGYYNTARPHVGIKGQTPQQTYGAL